MYSTSEARGKRVYIRNKKGRLKKRGKLRLAIFHPKRARLVGYVVRRPDFLLMFKRKEHFLAADRIKPVENGFEVTGGSEAWDAAACKRLGISYDQCIAWENMPIHTESGQDLGTVKNTFYDEHTLAVDHIDISSSALARKLLGSSDISRDMIRGYKNGAIIVKEEASDIEEAGGVAAAAGEAWAKTKHSASIKAKEAGEAVDDGAFKMGEAIGTARKKMNEAVDTHEQKKEREEARGEKTGVDKAANMLGQQLGRASGMFKNFKDEFDKASHDD